MVILKSTEIAQKMSGYKIAADKFDKKIAKLNQDNKRIQDRLKANIQRKEELVKQIEKLVWKLGARAQSDEEEDELSALMAIKVAFENDIASFYNSKSLEVKPINNIIEAYGIDSIAKAMTLLSSKKL